jgi:hypothetical protein
MTQETPIILLTIDVEDWFQVENFKSYIPFSTWPNRELRVEKNTHRLLDLLDSVRLQSSTFRVPQGPEQGRGVISDQPGYNSNPKATFFVLGWIAERLPHLVKEIHARGHEVASHGYVHELCYRQCFRELEEDLQRSKKLLEDIVGARIYGYRAPSFSINPHMMKLIESFSLYGRYGKPNLSCNGRNGIAFQLSGKFYEIPISNLNLANA